MNKIGFLIFFSTCFATCLGQDLAKYINPKIGTDGAGHTFPGACTPFGMVQLSPDTRIDNSWEACSGYHFSDKKIYGFSHTHLSGTGVPDLCDIAFLPLFSDHQVLPEHFNDTVSVAFQHKNEIASAGFYSVKLENGIVVNLTATPRCGFQQYEFMHSGFAYVILNLKHRDFLIQGNIEQIDKQNFCGYRNSKSWALNQWIYFYSHCNTKPNQTFFIKDKNASYKLIMEFVVKKGQKIEIKTAISGTGIQGAKKNYNSEIKNENFTSCKKSAILRWNQELKQIQIKSKNKTFNTIFYSAFYHCLIHPSVYSDVDSQYRAPNGTIHKANWGHYYTIFSLWDTYRALHPLLNLTHPKTSRDFIKTFQEYFSHTGRLPMWELWGNETNCMIGMHSIPVILDAFNKNVISLEELKEIFPAVSSELNSTRNAISTFRQKGYLEIKDEPESVSKTVEYSYDFYCAAHIAQILNEKDSFQNWMNLASGFYQLFNPLSGFVQPLSNAQWLPNFDPYQVNNHFTEGNSWHYSFPQYNFKQTISNINLHSLFYTHSNTTGRKQPDISGLIGQYAHGNEPSHHIPYLYMLSDSARAAEIIQKICSEFYKNSPNGLIGNDDCGQLSAWYVFSALGFYPADIASNMAIWGKPQVEFAEIKNKMKIYDSRYILRNSPVSLSNKNPNSPKILAEVYTFNENNNNKLNTANAIFSRKSFVFNLNEHSVFSHYAVSKTNLDSLLFTTYVPVNSIPKVIEKQGVLYLDSSSKISKSVFFATTLAALKNYNLFPEKIEPNNFTKYYLQFENEPFYSVYYHKKTSEKKFKITLITPPLNSYSEKGELSLRDNDTGTVDWRTGNWLGFQQSDPDLVVDLGAIKPIKTIGIGALQDVNSWIFFPREFQIFTSENGFEFKLAASVSHQFSDTSYRKIRNNFIHQFNSELKAKYVRITAVQYGKLPQWHAGKGEDSIIFLDEISIE